MLKTGRISIKNGQISADFSGFAGKSCVALEKKIRPDELKVESQELKPEYHFDTDKHSDTDSETNSF